jgi:hypothetical protein
MGDIGPTRAKYEVLPADDLDTPVALPLADAPSDDAADGAFPRGSGPDRDSRYPVER